MNAEQLQLKMLITQSKKCPLSIRVRNAVLGLIAWVAWIYIIAYFLMHSEILLGKNILQNWQMNDVFFLIAAICSTQLVFVHLWVRHKKRRATQ
jgi:hypothetical protein